MPQASRATLKHNPRLRRLWRAAQAGLAASFLLIVAVPAFAQDVDAHDQRAAQQVPDQKLIAGLERLAEANNGEAIYYLGMAYHLGLDVPKDKAKALGLFRRSAELGDPLGAYKLGCYYDGQGDGVVAEDPDLALKYTLVAAEAGYALAEHDVALLYAGRKDFTLARAWLKKAAVQGWPVSLRAYASIHNGAAGVARDRAVAAAYFRLYAATSEAGEAHKIALAEFEDTLSAADKAREAEILAAYHPESTPLTLRGLAGQRAAQALVEGGR